MHRYYGCSWPRRWRIKIFAFWGSKNSLLIAYLFCLKWGIAINGTSKNLVAAQYYKAGCLNWPSGYVGISSRLQGQWRNGCVDKVRAGRQRAEQSSFFHCPYRGFQKEVWFRSKVYLLTSRSWCLPALRCGSKACCLSASRSQVYPPFLDCNPFQIESSWQQGIVGVVGLLEAWPITIVRTIFNWYTAWKVS